MRRRLFCPLLAAAVLATALGGVATSASAAIRIVISDGNPANDQVFYSQFSGSENQLGVAFTTTFDGYDLLTSTTTSNFSGSSTEGFLSQSVVVTDAGGGPLSQLRVSTAIIGNLGFATGQVFGANAATVAGAPSLLFTLPSDQFLSVTSRVNTLGATDTNAVVQLNTVVNGGTTTSSTTVDGSVNQTMGTALGLPGYTLESTIILTGLSPGVSGLQAVGRSSVTVLTPEPGPLALWGLGALGIVATAAGRRWRFLAPV